MKKVPGAIAASLILAAGSAFAQPYFPNMSYGAKQTIAPGVTWQHASQTASPAQNIFIVEVDKSVGDIELMPVFKAAGNVSGSSNEITSYMGQRTNALASMNAGYYDTSLFLTNSYTEIDGLFIGGTNTSMTPESNRSVIGFSYDHQAIAKMTKLSTAFVPANATNWPKIVDAIQGRGHFITSGGTLVTQDNEGTGAGHYGARHPRSVIGFNTSPYKVYLVAIDGRAAGFSEGMTYTEVGQLMADLGVENSISLDGGGSTAMWVKGQGVVNVPSDGAERAVISAWAVVNANTMDNQVSEFSSSGAWTVDTTSTQKYYEDHLITDDTLGAASATWNPNLSRSGLYRVYAWYSAAGTRATAAPYEIVHADGTETVTVNQRFRGGQWVVLGAYNFNAGAGGSVTLRNTAPGTISADGVRFVRVSDIPTPEAPQYNIGATIYQTDFETNQSANFTTSQRVAGDNSVNFNYDYSTFAQAGGIHPQEIPQAPNSTGSSRRGLRLGTNLSNGVANAITTTLTSISAQDDVRITFDAWVNYNGAFAGGAGSSQFITIGGSANAALYSYGDSSYLSAPASNAAFNGMFFAISSEGQMSQDFRYYDGNGSGGATGNNGARANFLGISAINNGSFMGTFAPINMYETPGSIGKAWNRWEMCILDGKVRLSVIKPDGIPVTLCNWFTPNAGATTTGLRPSFGIMDPLSGVASPSSDVFVLIDNLLVQNISAISRTDDWTMY
ncbi:phosphodiester glycosidase family protein [Candidatus Sumerlaeota bacterium]|nr:phosphodiester glycosidase family protein [Candidatus Sumerlaeota bacterium]